MKTTINAIVSLNMQKSIVKLKQKSHNILKSEYFFVESKLKTLVCGKIFTTHHSR